LHTYLLGEKKFDMPKTGSKLQSHSLGKRIIFKNTGNVHIGLGDKFSNMWEKNK
jgi:hypothetical protein